MKQLLIALVFCSCNNKREPVENNHIERIAKNFMEHSVIPQMNYPKSYEFVSAKVVTNTVADYINDYRFVYDHLSLNKSDSIENKKHLDSIIKVSLHPDSIISVTVNVAYKTKYKYGDVVIDSIKLGYDRKNDKISLWPF